MKLSEAIEAIKNASLSEYFKRIDAIELTDWKDVAFTFYEEHIIDDLDEENAALKRLIKDEFDFGEGEIRHYLKHALLTAEEEE